MLKTFSDKVIDFNQHLSYDGLLPEGFRVLNPFFDNPETIDVMKQFYQKFYHDNRERNFLIGINPSRHGAGVTGVPFTDTKRLSSACGIEMKSAKTHEISSVFMYSVIDLYGGAMKFYQDFYINSPFPLAIVRLQKEKWVNANYYDNPKLYELTKPFMIASLKRHITLGLNTNEVIVLGKKNATYIQKINKETHLFKKLIILDHPRFIQQYKLREIGLYQDQYLEALNELNNSN